MNANELIQHFSHHQVVSKIINLPANGVEELHTHSWHQVLFPISGLLQSTIEGKSIIVPHNGMLFIPANAIHKSVSVSKTQFLAVYLNPKSTVSYGNNAKSCLVTPFLKELIVLLVEQGLDNHTEQMTTNLLVARREV